MGQFCEFFGERALPQLFHATPLIIPVVIRKVLLAITLFACFGLQVRARSTFGDVRGRSGKNSVSVGGYARRYTTSSLTGRELVPQKSLGFMGRII